MLSSSHILLLKNKARAVSWIRKCAFPNTSHRKNSPWLTQRQTPLSHLLRAPSPPPPPPPPLSLFSHPRQRSQLDPRNLIHGPVVRISINLTKQWHSNITLSSVRMKRSNLAVTLATLVSTTTSLSTVSLMTTWPVSPRITSEKRYRTPFSVNLACYVDLSTFPLIAIIISIYTCLILVHSIVVVIFYPMIFLGVNSGK